MGEVPSPGAAAASAVPRAAPAAHHARAFLFADLRGFTAYTEEHGDRAAAALLERYRAVVRLAVAASEGAEVRTEGDSFYVVFESASAAVTCGLAVAAGAAADRVGDPIRAGVGVDAGEAEETPEGLVGSAVNTAARVCAEAGPGQVVVTEAVRLLTRTYLDVAYRPLGARRLKGVAEPVPLYLVVPRGAAAHRVGGRARSRRALLAAGAAAGLVVLAASALAGQALLRGQRAEPASSAPASAAATSAASATTIASAGGPPASGTPFPTPAEAALLARLVALPGLEASCTRGPYVAVPAFRGPATLSEPPTASLDCHPGLSSGASDVLVRRFGQVHPGGNDFVGGILENIVYAHTTSGGSIPPGNCQSARNSESPWSVGPVYEGQVVCYANPYTREEVLMWTYDTDQIIVTARNQDTAWRELYGYFLQVARFIAP